MSTMTFDSLAGQHAKEQGMRQAAEHRSRTLTLARTLARTIAERNPNGEVSADDVMQALALKGYTSSDLGNAAGSLFTNGEWVAVGYRKSTRVTNHRRQVRVWKLKNRIQ